jgi:hypothetical protein
MVRAGDAKRIAERVELGAGRHRPGRPRNGKRLKDEHQARRKRDPPARYLFQLDQA